MLSFVFWCSDLDAVMEAVRGVRRRDRRRDLGAGQRRAATSESVGWQNFGKMLLVFGCIGSDFCKKIFVLQHFSNLPDSQADIFEI